MTNDKQLTISDIKGDLAQRLGCASCTVKLNQTAKIHQVQLDRKETKEPNSKRAISFICDDCTKAEKQPARAHRLIVASDGSHIVNEINVEDLPSLGEGSARAAAQRSSRKTKTSRRATSRTRTKKEYIPTTPTTTPTAEGARETAKSIVTTVDK